MVVQHFYKDYFWDDVYKVIIKYTRGVAIVGWASIASSNVEVSFRKYLRQNINSSKISTRSKYHYLMRRRVTISNIGDSIKYVSISLFVTVVSYCVFLIVYVPLCLYMVYYPIHTLTT